MALINPDPVNVPEILEQVTEIGHSPP